MIWKELKRHCRHPRKGRKCRRDSEGKLSQFTAQNEDSNGKCHADTGLLCSAFLADAMFADSCTYR